MTKEQDWPAFQAAWQKLIDHCYANGLRDCLMQVRAGYAAELRSERQARRRSVEKAVSVEPERSHAVMAAVEAILEDGRMNTEHLACLRVAWEAAQCTT